MTTLEGRHPLIAIRTRSRRPASLLTVVLIAAATLVAAVGVALLTEDEGSSPSVSSQSAAAPAVRSSAEPGVLTPRVTETPARQAQVPAGARYDGGPEEGSRGVAGGSGSTDLSRPHYDGRSLVPGR